MIYLSIKYDFFPNTILMLLQLISCFPLFKPYLPFLLLLIYAFCLLFFVKYSREMNHFLFMFGCFFSFSTVFLRSYAFFEWLIFCVEPYQMFDLSVVREISEQSRQTKNLLNNSCLSEDCISFCGVDWCFYTNWNVSVYKTMPNVVGHPTESAFHIETIILIKQRREDWASNFRFIRFSNLIGLGFSFDLAFHYFEQVFQQSFQQ